MTIVAQVGNYGESFQRNLGPLGVDRGYNRLWHDGGLMFATADVIVGIKYHTSLPRPENLRLFHVPGAGYDAVDLAALPVSAVVCNCFGHEQAIAEYVMAALLAPNVPLRDADRRLRLGDWAYWAGASNRVHGELAGSTVGLLGFGHIGKAVAARAKAFEMRVHVANCSRARDRTGRSRQNINVPETSHGKSRSPRAIGGQTLSERSSTASSPCYSWATSSPISTAADAFCVPAVTVPLRLAKCRSRNI